MSEEIKPNAIAEARAAAKKVAAELAAKRADLKKNIGQSFTLGERTGTVVDFYPDKVLGANQGDAFLVNFGNPNRSDFIFAKEFLTNYKTKE